MAFYDFFVIIHCPLENNFGDFINKLNLTISMCVVGGSELMFGN